MKKIFAILLLLPAFAFGGALDYYEGRTTLSNAVYDLAAIAAPQDSGALKAIILRGVYTPRAITNIATTNTAWVSTLGSNSTGTRGDSNAPFLNISNAVKALAPGGLVLIGPGVFSETWVPLNRTNAAGISLCGAGAARTIITGSANYSLTNYGNLVALGHRSLVTSLTISNDISDLRQQAAIGFDTTKLGGVNATNVTLRSLDLWGNSDCGYFNDNSGADVSSLTAEYVRTRAKWDSWFFNPVSDDALQTLRYCWLRCDQPDGYFSAQTNVWAGNVRTLLVSAGGMMLENCVVEAVGGRNSFGIVTAFYSTQGINSPTNWNSTLSASGTHPAATVMDFYQGGEPIINLTTWSPTPP